MIDLYVPKSKPIPSPCGRHCAGREPGCAAMCCTWQLYITIRNHIYGRRLEEKRCMELNDKASAMVARAKKKRAKKGRKEWE